jgi:deazaflavin-dependent oxidoreductase (nitroreductase family)
MWKERSSIMEVTAPFEQHATGTMAYPRHGTFNRILFKAPVVGWRMGMGAILGRSMLVLTTWGRKTHLPRHTMLSFTPMKETIYVGAGWGAHCDWYQNLVADTQVTLQVWDKQVTGVDQEMTIPALARRVTDEGEIRQVFQRLLETSTDAYLKPWLRSLGIDHDLDDMLAKRERLHQVALDLQPVDQARRLLQAGYPPAMETDLKWVWAVMAGAYLLGWWTGRRRR